MIARVYGKVQDVEVSFPLKEGNIYSIEFPHGMSGKIIVEVYAEDAAGNISYCNKLLCVVDVNGACIHVEPIRFYLEPLQYTYVVSRMCNDIYLEAIPPAKCRGGYAT